MYSLRKKTCSKHENPSAWLSIELRFVIKQRNICTICCQNSTFLHTNNSWNYICVQSIILKGPFTIFWYQSLISLKIAFIFTLDIYIYWTYFLDRLAIKQVLERITYSIFQNVVRALIDKDRFVYALLLALEIEDSEGHVSAGEREYLINPHYGAAVAGIFLILSILSWLKVYVLFD